MFISSDKQIKTLQKYKLKKFLIHIYAGFDVSLKKSNTINFEQAEIEKHNLQRICEGSKCIKKLNLFQDLNSCRNVGYYIFWNVFKFSNRFARP